MGGLRAGTGAHSLPGFMALVAQQVPALSGSATTVVLSCKFFLLFWAYRLYDIVLPGGAYEETMSYLESTLQQERNRLVSMTKDFENQVRTC